VFAGVSRSAELLYMKLLDQQCSNFRLSRPTSFCRTLVITRSAVLPLEDRITHCTPSARPSVRLIVRCLSSAIESGVNSADAVDRVACGS